LTLYLLGGDVVKMNMDEWVVYGDGRGNVWTLVHVAYDMESVGFKKLHLDVLLLCVNLVLFNAVNVI